MVVLITVSFNLHQNCWIRRGVFSAAAMCVHSHSMFGSDSENELAEQFIELSRRHFFNVPESYFPLMKRF